VLAIAALVMLGIATMVISHPLSRPLQTVALCVIATWTAGALFLAARRRGPPLSR
jgi:hypothetical protein